MSKNILIINSSQDKNQPLINLFAELKQKGYIFFLRSSAFNLYNQFQQNSWPAKKIYLGPNLNSKFGLLGFIVLLPTLLLAYLTFLTYLTYIKKISTIICLNWNEKIIITPIAKILGLKIIWLECPNFNYQILNNVLLWLHKANSKKATIITFINLTKIQLKKLGWQENNIKIISPGIELNQFKRQDTIFNELAQASKGNFHRKYFTVGTIIDLSHKQKIETLFQAIKICLNVIPNLQLIIIGEGEERRSLTWLAKKMEIDNLVWFVGEQTHLRKWLDSFDIFVVTSEKPNLADFNICLQAMAAGLPIIGPQNFGLEDIVQENKTGFLIENNNEILAQQIIALQQNRYLCVRLGEEAKERVDKYFGIDKMVKQFEKIIGA